MPLYAGKHAICAFLRNIRNMLRSHVRYKPVSLNSSAVLAFFALTLASKEIVLFIQYGSKLNTVHSMMCSQSMSCTEWCRYLIILCSLICGFVACRLLLLLEPIWQITFWCHIRLRQWLSWFVHLSWHLLKVNRSFSGFFWVTFAVR